MAKTPHSTAEQAKRLLALQDQADRLNCLIAFAACAAAHADVFQEDAVSGMAWFLEDIRSLALDTRDAVKQLRGSEA